MSALCVGVTTTLLGVAVGFLLSYVGTWWRDKQQAKHEKRSLAGTLAAELEGFKATCPSDEQAVITWAAEQSYTPVYDSAGPRLYLLGGELVKDVAKCYSMVKRSLDECHRAQLMTQNVLVQVSGERSSAREVGNTHASEARRAAVATSQRAASAIDALLPKLDKVADEGK